MKADGLSIEVSDPESVTVLQWEGWQLTNVVCHHCHAYATAE